MADSLGIDEIKAQARVLIPLIQLLRQEIGVERANQLVVRALASWGRELGEAFRKQFEGDSLTKLKQAVQGLDATGLQITQFLDSPPATLSYNITRCQVAEFYRSLGLGELGFLLVCTLDYSIIPSLDPDLQLQRTQTLMEGAPHCDFRFKQKRSE